MSQNARVGKAVPLIGQVQVARISLRSQDVADWQNAVNAARSELMPRRKSLLELYDNTILDGHLASVMGKRTLNVSNKKIAWTQEGANDALIHAVNAEVLRTPWFYDLIEGSMSVVPYGTTLLELVPQGGKVIKCAVMPRANVVPEFGYLVQDAANSFEPWIHYRTDPYWSTYLIEVGKPRDLGALIIASLLALWKRGQFGDWAQYNELFGMPFRVGKYNPWDDTTRTKLYTALSEMGGAGYAVIPNGTEVDFHEAKGNGTGQATFKDLVELCNSEMSKLFLGQTMTTDQGSSRSQGEVHKEVENDITLADMRRTEFLLNWELKPRLTKLGYPMDKGEFTFDLTRNLPLETRIDLDVKVAKQLGGQVPDRYWYDTYGVPMPGKGDTINGGKPLDEPEAPDTPPTKKDDPDPDEDPEPARTGKDRTAKMEAQVNALYFGGHHPVNAGDDGDGAPDAILNELAQAIHDGRLTDGWVDPQLMQWTADQLFAGVMGGMQVVDDEPQGEQLRSFMQRNVMVFSGFKTHHMLRKATDQLLNKDGEPVPFSVFKKRILAIDKEYNVRYLKAEYAHAVASGQMAERWQDIERDAELFPFLSFDTAGDDRVRTAHARLDGIKKRVEDPFWDSHMPPLDWGCRCDVNQHADGPASNTDPALLPVVPEMFRNNVGKTGVVFPKSHPFYKAPKAVKAEVDAAVNAAMGTYGTQDWQDVPVPEIPKGPPTKPKGKPVKDAMKVNATGRRGQTTKEVMDIIGKVHGDGELPTLLLRHDQAVDYGRITAQDGPLRILIDFTDPHHRTHIIHEVGHWLDWYALNPQGKGFASEIAEDTVDHPMRPLMQAIRKSKAVKHLQRIADLEVKPKDPKGNAIDLIDSELYYIQDYLLLPRELHARAYTQYIVEKSGNKELMRSIVTWDRRMFNGDMRRHWDPKDFAPIRTAFDELFKSKAWLSD